MQTSGRATGFTLIEMMAVVAIMAVLSTIVVMNVVDRIEWAKVETTKTKMRALDMALGIYQIERGRFPASDPGLTALVEDEDRSFV